jgi:hypothetical protein
MDLWLRNHLIIIQHQHQVFMSLGQSIDEGREHRLPGGLRVIMECRRRKPRESGLTVFQCRQHIGPKLKRSVITHVKRHPGNWLRAWNT